QSEMKWQPRRMLAKLRSERGRVRSTSRSARQAAAVGLTRDSVKNLQRQLLKSCRTDPSRVTLRVMSFHRLLLTALTAVTACFATYAGEHKPGESPADHLPPHIRRVTWFGERADWSHDGKRVLFLSKTFGDAMELELSTMLIRDLTAHYPHHGYTRALYL